MKTILKWIMYIVGWILLWFAIDSVGYVSITSWQFWVIILAVVLISITSSLLTKD